MNRRHSILSNLSKSRVFLVRNYAQQPFFKAAIVSNKSSNAAKKDRQFEATKKFKHHISDYLRNLKDPGIEKELNPLRAAIEKTLETIKCLKENNPSSEELVSLLKELKLRKKCLEDKEMELAPQDASFDRVKMNDLLHHCHFFRPAFSLYGATPGLFYFGDNGTRMMKNIISLWEDHFIAEDSMYEIISTNLTPESVLEASGHTERFSDLMIRDSVKGDFFRADHLLSNALLELSMKSSVDQKEVYEKLISTLGDFDDTQIYELIQRYKIMSPSGNPLSRPTKANQMFSVEFGFNGSKVFLRPETAQGIFVEFRDYLEANKGKLPFAVAQVGSSFRNEINPRHGLLRTREFYMCEIEHFYDPKNKDHQKFPEICDIELNLYTRDMQINGNHPVKISILNALEQRLLSHKTIGYYLVRTYVFLTKIGIDPKRLRFRQHLKNEMAHYAQDCWDAEIFTSYGWIECVGIADRGCHDLQNHSMLSGTKLYAKRELETPFEKETFALVPDMKSIERSFPQVQAKKIQKALRLIQKDGSDQIKDDMRLNIDGEEVQLSLKMFKLEKSYRSIKTEEFIPSVIEPSFGLGRILYAVLEHAFCQREDDEKRMFLRLAPAVAPIKCSVLPLNVNATKLKSISEEVCKILHKSRITFKLDDSNASIGRRYARTDMFGIPYGITIDFESEILPWSVTIRDSLSQKQIRVQVKNIGEILKGLISGELEWEKFEEYYPTRSLKV